MNIQIDMRQVVLLLARTLDLVGIDDVLHGRRVAIIAVQCAQELGWDRGVQGNLLDSALLHDIGVSSTRVHRALTRQIDWEEAHLHCERGSRILSTFAPLAHLAPVVLHHHSRWDELQREPHLDPAVALQANLISLSDWIDANAAPHCADKTILLHIEEIFAEIARCRGSYFAPQLVDAFFAAARAEAFWLILYPDFIPQFMAEMENYTEKRQIGREDLKRFALIVADIVDAKSHFTSEHSLGVARLALLFARHFGIQGHRRDLLEVAALMHDIGKLQIPDEVLESPLSLTATERAVMKQHSFATYQILKRLSGLEELALWASQHHESLNGNGYPFRLIDGEISLESRIIKVADIFQALAQDRPYRKSLPADEILVLLRELEADDEVDGKLVDFVAQHLDACHRAALDLPAD